MWPKLKKKKESMNFDDLTPPPDDYNVNYNREEEYRRERDEEDDRVESYPRELEDEYLRKGEEEDDCMEGGRRGDEEEDHLELEEDDQKNLGIKGNPGGEDDDRMKDVVDEDRMKDVVDEDRMKDVVGEEDHEPDGEDDELMEDGSDGEDHDFFIIRPFKSRYSLRTILLENGLSVLIVSNPTLALSSAAMSVRLGSVDDPSGMEGLAHMIEHLLFNETSDNRKKNHFREYCDMNGGDIYACTDTEWSGYSFYVDETKFDGALKLFGNMFKCPCILEEHIGDEIKSINQEFHMHTNDSVRLARILSHTTHKDHIINRFSSGNKESFSAHGHPSICNAILELIGSHIVGSNMKLVIVSPASFKHLEAQVKLNFDDLKVGPEFTPFPKHNNYIWMRHGLWDSSVAYEVESGENSQKMVISWMLPSVSMSSAEERPERLIQQLISEESDGSLSFFFKSKYWIFSLSSSVGFRTDFSEEFAASYSSTSAGQQFSIEIELTDCGWDHRYEMVSYVYEYLHLLKTIPYESLSTYIEESRSLRRMKFACLDVDQAQMPYLSQFSLALAVNMLKFPVTKAFSLEYLYGFGEENAFKEILGHFITKHMRIDFLSKPFKEEGETEPYYHIKYKKSVIPQDFIDGWMSVKEIDPHLHLPQPNQYMPTSFFEGLEPHLRFEEPEHDHALDNFNALRNGFQHKESTEFLSKAFIAIGLIPRPGILTHTVCSVLVEMVRLELQPLLTKAELAYISTEISFTSTNAIVLSLKGYHEKLREVITDIWTKFRSFEPNRKSFKYTIEMMKKRLYDDLCRIEKHAALLLNEALIEGSFTTANKLSVLDLMVFEDVEDLVTTFSKNKTLVISNAGGQFTGKFSPEDCIQISNLFQSKGNYEVQDKCLRPLSVASPYRVNASPLASYQKNTLAKVYFQTPSGIIDENAVGSFLSLLKILINEYQLSELRLRKRLAYDVGCEVLDHYACQGLFFYIISPDYKAEELMKELHEFISTIPDYLDSIDEEDFISFKKAVGGENSFLGELSKQSLKKLFHYFFILEARIIEICIG